MYLLCTYIPIIVGIIYKIIIFTCCIEAHQQHINYYFPCSSHRRTVQSSFLTSTLKLPLRPLLWRTGFPWRERTWSLWGGVWPHLQRLLDQDMEENLSVKCWEVWASPQVTWWGDAAVEVCGSQLLTTGPWGQPVHGSMVSNTRSCFHEVRGTEWMALQHWPDWWVTVTTLNHLHSLLRHQRNGKGGTETMTIVLSITEANRGSQLAMI